MFHPESSTVSGGPESFESRLRTSQRPPDHSSNVYGLNNTKNHGIRIVHAAAPESSTSNNAASEAVPGNDFYLPYMVNDLALEIKHTRSSRGLGVFTTHGFASFHRIVYEQPIFSCVHPMRIDAAGWGKAAAARWRLLSWLDQRWFKSRFAKIRHMPMGPQRLTARQTLDFLNFLLEYSFSNPQGSMIHVYRFASHINHACHSCANAEVWIDPEIPHIITVRLLRNVKKGREIFINYNRPSGNTFCCAICGIRDGETSRFAQFWHGMVRRVRGVRPIRHQSGQGPTTAEPFPSLSAKTSSDVDVKADIEAPAIAEAQTDANVTADVVNSAATEAPADVDVSEGIVDSATAEASIDANAATDVKVPSDTEALVGGANSPETRIPFRRRVLARLAVLRARMR